MTMSILNLQKRARELGRIRIGQVVSTQSGKTRPEKLDRFRLTSPAKHLLDRVAELYGGTVREWTPQGGGPQQWEVVTDARRIPILVPPQPVSQFMELWGGGGCLRRCDSVTELLTDSPCICKANEREECKPTTRLNVILRDIEGIGVWRLETHGWNAAMELPDSAAFLAQAGGYVNGWIALEERKRIVEGKTNRFMVPTIEIDVTPSELLAGGGRIAAPTLDGPVQHQAIEAHKGDAAAQQPAAALARDQLQIPTPEQIKAADLPTLRRMVDYLEQHGQGQHPAANAARKRIDWLEDHEDDQPQPDADGAVDADVVPDDQADAVWESIVREGGKQGMTLPDLQDGFAAFTGGLIAADATAGELAAYLEHLRAGVPA